MHLDKDAAAQSCCNVVSADLHVKTMRQRGDLAMHNRERQWFLSRHPADQSVLRKIEASAFASACIADSALFVAQRTVRFMLIFLN